MGKRITHKMAKKNRRSKIEEKYTRRTTRLQQSALNFAHELLADVELNLQVGVEDNLLQEMGAGDDDLNEDQENVFVAEAALEDTAMVFPEGVHGNGHDDGESNFLDGAANADDEDDDNVLKEMGTETEQRGGNTETVAIPEEEAHPICDDDPLKSREDDSQAHDEQKETGDLGHVDQLNDDKLNEEIADNLGSSFSSEELYEKFILDGELEMMPDPLNLEPGLNIRRNP